MESGERTERMKAFLARVDRLMEERGGGVIAIDGRCAAGKTTLAAFLSELYDCRVFHMDEFFLRPEQRTAERYAQPGGNVDYERFLREVLLPAKRGETVELRRFDCRTMTVQSPIGILPQPLTVVEGAYSLHPALAEQYDAAVFLTVEPELQRERILARKLPEEQQQQFFNRWIPLEEAYIQATHPEERCGMILEVGA